MAPLGDSRKAALLTTLALLPVFLAGLVHGAAGALMRGNESARQERLADFPYRLVLPAGIGRERVDAVDRELRAGLERGGPDGEIQAGDLRIERLEPQEVGRRLAIQEEWVARHLGDTPLPPELPTVFLIHSREVLLDPVASDGMVRFLEGLDRGAVVAFDQLALDAVLGSHRAERGREAGLRLVVSGVLWIGVGLGLLGGMLAGAGGQVRWQARLGLLAALAGALAGLGWWLGGALVGGG